MTTWTNDELSRIEQADELEITPLRGEGTPPEATTIWVVREGDDLYVRAYRGRRSGWFRAATERHAARISSGGVTKEVTLEETDGPTVAGRVDAAYRTKYGHYSATYVDPLVAEGAQDATLKLLPR